jgi:hypothetical protein
MSQTKQELAERVKGPGAIHTAAWLWETVRNQGQPAALQAWLNQEMTEFNNWTKTQSGIEWTAWANNILTNPPPGWKQN